MCRSTLPGDSAAENHRGLKEARHHDSRTLQEGRQRTAYDHEGGGFFPIFINLKNKVNFQGLCSFLEAACADESCPLDAYLEDILNALFPNTCIDPGLFLFV